MTSADRTIWRVTDAERHSQMLRWMRGEYTCEERMWEVFEEIFGVSFGFYSWCMLWIECEMEVIANG